MRFRRLRAWAITLVIAFTAAGCSNVGSGADGTVFRDSAGIAIAESDHTRPAWGTSGWRLTDAPLLEVGSVDAEGPEQFVRVVHARFLPSGDVAVVDNRRQHVVIFDGEGGHRRTIGREGDGPGEFRSPWQVYALPGDSLAVVEVYRAVSVFDSAGGYVRRFVPGGIVGDMQGVPIGQLMDGSLLLVQYEHEAQSGRTGLGWSQLEPVQIGLDGAVRTRFGLFNEQEMIFGSQAPYLFAARAKLAPDQDGFWYASGDRFEARRVGMDGRVLRLVRLDLPRRPVTPADIEQSRQRTLNAARGTPQEAITLQRFANVETPELMPAHDAMLVDDQGYLWIQEYRAYDPQVPRPWRVFDREGRHLGVVEMPSGFTPYQILGDRIVGRWIDESDVEFVRVYGVVR